MSRFEDEAVIGEALTRLSLARGVAIDKTTSDVYLERLGRFAPGLVRRACEVWMDIPRKDFEPALPEVGKLIQTIQRLAQEDADAEQMRRLPAPPRSDEPTFACPDCQDGDWGKPTWCPGSGAGYQDMPHARNAEFSRRYCGRPKPHAPHTEVDRCHCWGHNAIVERRRREQRTKPIAGAA